MPATSRTAHGRRRDSLAVATGAQKGDWLRRTAALIRHRTAELLEANEADCAAGREAGLSAALLDRLRLTESRLEGIARALEEVAALPEPVGEIIDSNVRPNGLVVTRVRVPLGVVFFIYESRPNVTVDAAALCVKSGNAVILRGGKEAHPQQPGAGDPLLSEALEGPGLPRDAVQLVADDRSRSGRPFSQAARTDRPGHSARRRLADRRVAAEATMPVIKHFDGICHVYVDRVGRPRHGRADPDQRQVPAAGRVQRGRIAAGASRRGPRVPAAGRRSLRERGVELRGCERSRALIPDARPATDDDFRTEYLDLILSVKVVDSLSEAIDHIKPTARITPTRSSRTTWRPRTSSPRGSTRRP